MKVYCVILTSYEGDHIEEIFGSLESAEKYCSFNFPGDGELIIYEREVLL